MTTKEFIIQILENNKGIFISGETIAKNLNISRAAISKAIKEIKLLGYNIESFPNKGYMLSNESDQLSVAEIKKYLKFPASIFIKKSLDSTNNEAKRMLINNCEDFSLIIANSQTQGRGRKGKTFFSPENSGIYFSIILKPNLKIDEALKITIAASLAVTRSIEKLTCKTTSIKWVNDILIENKKIAGILTEAISDFETRTIETIILGIGINFSTNYFPDEILNTSTSIFYNEKPSITRNHLIAEIVNEIHSLIFNLADSDLISEYKKKSSVIGKNVFIYHNSILEEVFVNDINEDGYLMVKTKNNEDIILNSGEISLKLK